MPLRMAVAGLLLAGCAGASREAPRPAPLRISATHYESMNGVQIDAGDTQLTCNRDFVTGSRILRWYCRPAGQPAQYLLGVPVMLVLR